MKLGDTQMNPLNPLTLIVALVVWAITIVKILMIAKDNSIVLSTDAFIIIEIVVAVLVFSLCLVVTAKPNEG